MEIVRLINITDKRYRKIYLLRKKETIDKLSIFNFPKCSLFYIYTNKIYIEKRPTIVKINA